jgi:hypothetical protein
LNAEASPEGVEADDPVDQVEAEQTFGREVRAQQRLDDNALREQYRLLAARRNCLLDRYCLEAERGSRPRLGI